jgi:hypothetical protein
LKLPEASLRNLVTPTLAGVALLVVAAAPITAQLGGKSVSEDSGPVSDGSRSVSHGSRPVHERGRTTHESSVGPLSGNSTYESASGPTKSGSVSDITAGTVASDRSLRREKAEARLAPAPPRIVWDETVEAPVFWEPVYNLDALVDEVSSIEPMARAEREPDEGSADTSDNPSIVTGE